VIFTLNIEHDMLLLDLVGFSFLQHSFIGLDDGVGKVRRNLGFGLADRKRFSSIKKDVCRIAAFELTGNLLGIDSSGDIIVDLVPSFQQLFVQGLFQVVLFIFILDLLLLLLLQLLLLLLLFSPCFDPLFDTSLLSFRLL
jgi:hypothetical protein